MDRKGRVILPFKYEQPNEELKKDLNLIKKRKK